MMESISIVLPTRKRPDALCEFLGSIKETTNNKDRIEVCVYVDEDDDITIECLGRVASSYPFVIKHCIGKVGMHRKTQCGWNEAYNELAKNSIIMMAADDFRFRMKNDRHWDDIVYEQFSRFPDKIVLVYGDDGFVSKRLQIPTFHFIHRRWIDAMPFWCPPYFTIDWVDTWQGDIATLLDRKVYVDDLFIEHMHFLIKKSPFDPIAFERIKEEKQTETNKKIYFSKEKQEERMRYANILRTLMKD